MVGETQQTDVVKETRGVRGGTSATIGGGGKAQVNKKNL